VALEAAGKDWEALEAAATAAGGKAAEAAALKAGT